MVGWSVLILQIGQHMIYGNLRRKVELLLVAHEKFAERREVEKLVIAPNEKELGLAFNENQMMVTESLSLMDEEEALQLKVALESKGKAGFLVLKVGRMIKITDNMVKISKQKIREHERVFTPSVIEPSFGIERIIYCLFEHSFYTRLSKAGMDN
ncbi:glycine--tRNA ligase, mitochondrial 1-like isoform X1 [Syzygium oleosum]|uniref:glycine--tRNA ligase, mitochondrial 1-like isoform X1 n=1 Tax=Syzygium oleosum TaxID=219896 RepID=UPI0024BB4B18|nr:glycine--tRNA ligase, mitochondrial 1-like isoform X1 [Syzygium oleosum]